MKKIDLTIFGYIIYLITYAIIVSFFGFGNSIANWRYYILIILLIFDFIVVFKRKNFSFKFKQKDLLFVIPLSILFYLVSLSKAKNVDIPLNIRTYVQICLFAMPTIYAFFTINYSSKEKVIQMMKITTIILLFAYFSDLQEPNHNFSAFLDIDNWLAINYFKSASFTESHNWAESFLQLFLFFSYFYYNSEKERKALLPYMIITFIFTFLCFKRLGMVFAIFVFLFRKRIFKLKIFKKNYALPLAILFVSLTFFYTNLMKGNYFSYNTVFKLTSGRNWILYLWKMKNYLSFGYGSSLLVIDRYLEMDLVQIYMELNIICLFAFCYFFFKICKKSAYATIIMIYSFLNMLTASSMPWQISWVIMMISIITIINCDEQVETENLHIPIEANSKN